MMRMLRALVPVTLLFFGAAQASGQPNTRPTAASTRAARDDRNTPRSTTTAPARAAEGEPRTAAAITQPTTRRARYTAPGPQFRGGAVVMAAVGAASMGRVVSAGKEASEAGVTGSRFIGGAQGLAAPQALTANAVVGQPGLQRGLPIGFGPLPRQNIFTRSINPVSGPNGAHAILTSAGFGPALRR